MGGIRSGISELGVKNSLIEANKKDIVIEIKIIERSGRSERSHREQREDFIIVWHSLPKMIVSYFTATERNEFLAGFAKP